MTPIGKYQGVSNPLYATIAGYWWETAFRGGGGTSMLGRVGGQPLLTGRFALLMGGNNDPDLFLEQRPVWSADGLINGEQAVGWPCHDLGCAGGPAYIFLRQVAGGTPT